jgi:hypothetical protein
VDEHAAPVRLGDQKLQRVERLSLAHVACEELRPRLDVRLIEGVALRANLKDYGVEP